MIFVTVPIAGSLKSASGWKQGDDAGFLYYVFRYHFFFMERQGDLAPKMGERFRKFSSPTGESTKIIESITVKESINDFTSALTRHLSNSEELRDVSSSIASQIGVKDIAGLKSEIKSQLSHKLQDSLTREKTINRTEYREQTHTISLERNIQDSVAKEYVVPAWYQQWCLDGYASFVDYLFVSYERKGLQIRRRRIKRPSATGKGGGSRSHDNVIKLNNQPVCCMKYWRPLPNSQWIEENSYKLEVEFPDEISVHKAERTYSGFGYLREDLPTLYDLSERAFTKRYRKEELPQEAA